MFAVAPVPLKLISTRPDPFAPRWKSMLLMAGPLVADGSALDGSMVAAVVTGCDCVPLLTTSTRLLPWTLDLYDEGCISSTTTRVRPPAATADTPVVVPTPMSWWRAASLVVSGKSMAIRGGVSVVKMFGCGTWLLSKFMRTSTRPPGRPL